MASVCPTSYTALRVTADIQKMVPPYTALRDTAYLQKMVPPYTAFRDTADIQRQLLINVHSTVELSSYCFVFKLNRFRVSNNKNDYVSYDNELLFIKQLLYARKSSKDNVIFKSVD